VKAVDVIYREKVARIFASRMRGNHEHRACGYRSPVSKPLRGVDPPSPARGEGSKRAHRRDRCFLTPKIPLTAI
jgi:hypothetical protein